MSEPEVVITEAEALANAIELAASCGVPEHWPESAKLLFQDAARLAALHKEIVERLVRDCDLISDGVLQSFARKQGRKACLATLGDSGN